MSRKDFMDGLARAMTSKLSWLVAAVCSISPFWLAEYYFDGSQMELAVKGTVMLISFAAVFAFLAYRKARKI